MASYARGRQMNVAELMVCILSGLREVDPHLIADLEELIGKSNVHVSVASFHHLDHLCNSGR